MGKKKTKLDKIKYPTELIDLSELFLVLDNIDYRLKRLENIFDLYVSKIELNEDSQKE